MCLKRNSSQNNEPFLRPSGQTDTQHAHNAKLSMLHFLMCDLIGNVGTERGIT